MSSTETTATSSDAAVPPVGAADVGRPRWSRGAFVAVVTMLMTANALSLDRRHLARR